MNKVSWRRRGTTVSETEIMKVQKYLNIDFPADFMEVALEYHGSSVKPYCIEVNESEKVLGALLSFSNQRSENFINIFDSLKERLADRIIPFAISPGGDFFCFDYRGGTRPNIIYLEHESLISEDDYTEEQLQKFDLIAVQEKAIRYICDTFTDLLGLLY